MLYVIGLLVIFVFAIRDGDNTPLVTLKPLTIAGPVSNNGNRLKAVRGPPTNMNQRENLPLLNSPDQEIGGLVNKVRQSFGARDPPNPPPYILRNGEMECRDYKKSCPEYQRNGECVNKTVRWDCPQSCGDCVCADILPQPKCTWYQERGDCQNAMHNNLTKLWCSKTCGFCQPTNFSMST